MSKDKWSNITTKHRKASPWCPGCLTCLSVSHLILKVSYLVSLYVPLTRDSNFHDYLHSSNEQLNKSHLILIAHLSSWNTILLLQHINIKYTSIKRRNHWICTFSLYWSRKTRHESLLNNLHKKHKSHQLQIVVPLFGEGV